MRPNRSLKLAVFSALIAVTFLFTYFKTHDLLLGVKITVEIPINGQTVHEPFIHIRGKAPGSVLLSINGTKVLTDTVGNFEEAMLLGMGYNVIEIRSLDRFNRDKKKVVELVYKPKEKSGDSVAISR